MTPQAYILYHLIELSRHLRNTPGVPEELWNLLEETGSAIQKHIDKLNEEEGPVQARQSEGPVLQKSYFKETTTCSIR
jgi:septation ring formation regulator EzrA